MFRNVIVQYIFTVLHNIYIFPSLSLKILRQQKMAVVTHLLAKHPPRVRPENQPMNIANDGQEKMHMTTSSKFEMTHSNILEYLLNHVN